MCSMFYKKRLQVKCNHFLMFYSFKVYGEIRLCIIRFYSSQMHHQPVLFVQSMACSSGRQAGSYHWCIYVWLLCSWYTKVCAPGRYPHPLGTQPVNDGLLQNSPWESIRVLIIFLLFLLMLIFQSHFSGAWLPIWKGLIKLYMIIICVYWTCKSPYSVEFLYS